MPSVFIVRLEFELMMLLCNRVSERLRLSSEIETGTVPKVLRTNRSKRFVKLSIFLTLIALVLLKKLSPIQYVIGNCVIIRL